MSTAGSLTAEPTSPASLSMVRTSSTDALLCLPPQRTIAYTKDLSLPGVSPPRRSRPRPNVEATGPADITRHSPAELTILAVTPPHSRGRRPRSLRCAARHADDKEYQTACPALPAAARRLDD